MTKAKKMGRTRKIGEAGAASLDEDVRTVAHALRGQNAPQTVTDAFCRIVAALYDREKLERDEPVPEPYERVDHVENRARRHDAAYVPAGTKLLGGWLLPVAPARADPPFTPADRAAIADVLWHFGVQLLVDGPRTYEQPDGTIRDVHGYMTAIHEVFVQAQGVAEKCTTWSDSRFPRPVIHAAYEALFRHPVGEGWRPVLEDVLHGQVRVREQERLRKAKGLPLPPRYMPSDFCIVPGRPARHDGAPPIPNPAYPLMLTGTEILEHVRQRSGDPVPRQLTARVVELAVEQINLGGKGGRGKRGLTAEQWVADFADRISGRTHLAPKRHK